MATIPNRLPALYDVIAQCRAVKIRLFLNSKIKYHYFFLVAKDKAGSVSAAAAKPLRFSLY